MKVNHKKRGIKFKKRIPKNSTQIARPLQRKMIAIVCYFQLMQKWHTQCYPEEGGHEEKMCNVHNDIGLEDIEEVLGVQLLAIAKEWVCKLKDKVLTWDVFDEGKWMDDIPVKDHEFNDVVQVETSPRIASVE